MTYKVGLLGLGTVGAGVAKILQDPNGRHPLLPDIEIARVGVRSLNKQRDVAFDPNIVTDDLESIVNDPAINIVVEVIGGIEPAKSLILKAIANGKHVVTANKAVIARHGNEIFSASKQKNVYVMLEAAACGGIPVIQALKQSLGANRITELTGIVNGTTNYILSRMYFEGADFGDTLAEAQKLGYAEADPTADVDGYDAADKMAILASLAFGDRVNLEDIYREGIRSITSADIGYAKELGFTIKLLGIARRAAGKEESDLEIRVHPTLIPIQHPLANIHGVTNAVRIEGDPVGEVVFSGPGAGSGATASAVVADIINVVAALKSVPNNINQLMGCSHEHYAKIAPIENTVTQFYARLLTHDKPGVIGDLGTAFGHHHVSLNAILQKNTIHDGLAEIVVVTQQVSELNFQQAIAAIRELPTLHSIPTILRVL
ncbi:homoserine dehydrogenase [Pseudanabaena yagii]|uniref:Homoserine dehydrogenase n=1 Tax=Pseudanabaena yagii GIHE-NHR1 TaxID=2722753 RepID=A0ABX1LXY7_9CYAN|nr:homoserine dehydrogenase [Pseudanabaena yagii]NMF60336.1 homoserine dehydrogenase [Pseudanabaena yagii GIHE-NHR1]